MSFASVLDEYCANLDCTNGEIAAACGISASTLSRYLHGERTPDKGAVEKLAVGIARLSQQRGGGLEASDVKSHLIKELSGSKMVGMNFNMRLDALMHLTGTSNAAMARGVGVDQSYISRIRRGQRKPANISWFATACAHVAADKCLEHNQLEELGELIGISNITLKQPGWNPQDASYVSEAIEIWLKGGSIIRADMDSFDKFLLWVDKTDFSPWLHLADAANGEEKTFEPEAPDSFARFYYGVDGMRSAEIEFLNMAAATHARSASFSTDMPLMTIEPGTHFLNDYRQGLTRLLKQGCQITVFYNVERPLKDTIQSLRLWSPMYATGNVKPYYLPGVNNRLFLHMNYACDTCALAAESVVGHEEDGRYYFTTRPADVTYYQRKAEFMSENAMTLLEIYRDCDPEQKEAFEKAEAERQATGEGRLLGEGRFRNLKIVSYRDNCTVLTVPCGETDIHLVVRHPKINYLIARAK